MCPRDVESSTVRPVSETFPIFSEHSFSIEESSPPARQRASATAASTYSDPKLLVVPSHLASSVMNHPISSPSDLSATWPADDTRKSCYLMDSMFKAHALPPLMRRCTSASIAWSTLVFSSEFATWQVKPQCAHGCVSVHVNLHERSTPADTGVVYFAYACGSQVVNHAPTIAECCTYYRTYSAHMHTHLHVHILYIYTCTHTQYIKTMQNIKTLHWVFSVPRRCSQLTTSKVLPADRSNAAANSTNCQEQHIVGFGSLPGTGLTRSTQKRGVDDLE